VLAMVAHEVLGTHAFFLVTSVLVVAVAQPTVRTKRTTSTKPTTFRLEILEIVPWLERIQLANAKAILLEGSRENCAERT
jgi:hypothetical protein